MRRLLKLGMLLAGLLLPVVFLFSFNAFAQEKQKVYKSVNPSFEISIPENLPDWYVSSPTPSRPYAAFFKMDDSVYPLFVSTHMVLYADLPPEMQELWSDPDKFFEIKTARDEKFEKESLRDVRFLAAQKITLGGLPAFERVFRSEETGITYHMVYILFREGVLDLCLNSPISSFDGNDRDFSAIIGTLRAPGGKTAEEFFKEAGKALMSGEYAEAVTGYTKAIELNPDFADAYCNRGGVYAAQGNHDQAIADFTKAIEFIPDFAPAYVNRGNSYNARGDFDLAIEDLNKAIELNYNGPAVYYNRGCSYSGKEEFDLAVEDYTKTVELNPDHGKAYCNRAAAYYSKEEYDKAWDDVRKAAELGVNSDPGFLEKLKESSGREE